MSRPQDKAGLQRLLAGLPDATIREICIDALRAWHLRHPTATVIAMHGELGREVVPMLLARLGETLTADEQNQLKEPFIDAQDEPWMVGVSEFIWWFIGAGFAVPTTFIDHNLTGMRLTRRGVAFLASTEDHPLLPGFIDRVRTRCKGLPDDVITLVLDASRCLDHVLLRPAIVMMGVAYELAIEAVAESLVKRNLLQPTVLDQNAARRISTIRGVIDSVLPASTSQERDDRFAAHRAYDFADDLRRRRNDASHTDPRYGFVDRQEVEEFIVSSGRNLPPLWSMFA
jgi:hypothetical protein